jgi:hypothetical protein
MSRPLPSVRKNYFVRFLLPYESHFQSGQVLATDGRGCDIRIESGSLFGPVRRVWLLNSELEVIP